MNDSSFSKFVSHLFSFCIPDLNRPSKTTSACLNAASKDIGGGDFQPGGRLQAKEFIGNKRATKTKLNDKFMRLFFSEGLREYLLHCYYDKSVWD